MKEVKIALTWLLLNALLAAVRQSRYDATPVARLLKDSADGQKPLKDSEEEASPTKDDKHDQEPVLAASLLEKGDFIGKASRPHQQQPFYLMPAFFALKLTFTVMVFGFSINFKPKKGDPSAAMEWMKWLAKSGAALVFIAMALNGYITDFRRLRTASKHSPSWVEGFMLFVTTVVTSSNFVASQAVWCALSVENPKRLFGLTPKYREMPFFQGIPLKPGEARFLPPLKHAYALVLLPYIVGQHLIGFMLGLLLCGWTISTRCFNLCLTLKLFFYGCGSLWLVFISLGLWPWARSCLSYWWSIGWPFLYLLLIQAWASFFSPLFFTLLYGVLTRSSCEDILKGLKQGSVLTAAPADTSVILPTATAEDRNREAEKQDPTKVTLEDDDRKALIAMNWNELQEDFEQPDDFQSDAVAESFNDAKIMIFKATLTTMGQIVLTQFITLFTARGYFTHDDVGYAQALYRTAMERTMGSYLGNLKRTGENALEHFAAASDYLDVIWKIL